MGPTSRDAWIFEFSDPITKRVDSRNDFPCAIIHESSCVFVLIDFGGKSSGFITKIFFDTAQRIPDLGEVTKGIKQVSAYRTFGTCDSCYTPWDFVFKSDTIQVIIACALDASSLLVVGKPKFESFAARAKNQAICVVVIKAIAVACAVDCANQIATAIVLSCEEQPVTVAAPAFECQTC
jgi:hypothetical protein